MILRSGSLQPTSNRQGTSVSQRYRPKIKIQSPILWPWSLDGAYTNTSSFYFRLVNPQSMSGNICWLRSQGLYGRIQVWQPSPSTSSHPARRQPPTVPKHHEQIPLRHNQYVVRWLLAGRKGLLSGRQRWPGSWCAVKGAGGCRVLGQGLRTGGDVRSLYACWIVCVVDPRLGFYLMDWQLLSIRLKFPRMHVSRTVHNTKGTVSGPTINSLATSQHHLFFQPFDFYIHEKCIFKAFRSNVLANSIDKFLRSIRSTRA